MHAIFRHELAAALMIVAASVIVAPSGFAQSSDTPPVVRRNAPGPGHAALKPLEGRWRVEHSVYIVLGTADKPAVSTDIICRREWVSDGRYLRDVTEGTIAGQPYYREGLLGYSNMDQRYEWVTVDMNTMMMIYRGAAGTGPQMPTTVSGVFTDPGWLGEDNVGKEVPMRTTIRIESNDRHVFDLYFTPPGKPEILVDRKIYSRLTN
jgi:hypothetical protein